MEIPQFVKDHKTMFGNDLKKIYIRGHNSLTRTFGQSYGAPLNHKLPSNESERKKINFFSKICCRLRNKLLKQVKDPKVSYIKETVHPTYMIGKRETHETNTGNTYDFGCQNSLRSNCSLEIISHVLSRSVSHHSSTESIISLKWQRTKQPNALQALMMSLAKITKSKNPKLHVNNKTNHVIVLHVPKKSSNTSTLGTASPTLITSERVEKPLIIKDEFSHDSVANASHRSIICRPG